MKKRAKNLGSQGPRETNAPFLNPFSCIQLISPIKLVLYYDLQIRNVHRTQIYVSFISRYSIIVQNSRNFKTKLFLFSVNVLKILFEKTRSGSLDHQRSFQLSLSHFLYMRGAKQTLILYLSKILCYFVFSLSSQVCFIFFIDLYLPAYKTANLFEKLISQKP